MITIVLQITGDYKKIGETAITSYKKHFLPNLEKHFIIFSEHEEIGEVKTRKLPLLHSLTSSIYRYELFLDAKKEILESDFMFYVDADTEVVKEINDQVLPDKTMTAVQHPFATQQFNQNLPRTSKYWMPENEQGQSPYWQCCFFGGLPSAIIDMAEELSPVVRKEINTTNHKVADEGYFNSYWIKRKHEVKTLSNAYAHPTKTHTWPHGAWSDVKTEDIYIKHHNSASFGIQK